MSETISAVIVRLAAMAGFLLLSISGLAYAAEGVEWAPRPAWVSDIAIPAPVEEHVDQISGGVYFLLSTEQVLFDGKTRSDYFRNVSEITNRNGLESGSSVAVSYRPGKDELRLHRLVIHRDGETIDLTGKVEFETFRRESELSDGILNGTLTAFANLPQVRVGDVVDFAFSRSYSTLMLPGDLYDTMLENYSDPTARVDLAVTFPAALELEYRLHNGADHPAITLKDGMRTYAWSRAPAPAAPAVKSAPGWYSSFAYVDVSTVKSWADIARDVTQYYPEDTPLPQTVIAELDAIRAKSDDRRRWVADVLKLVQKDIRYVGVEIGDGAFVPRTPETVVRLGYGDCKDKAWLMATALRRLGIDAVPALAHLTQGEALKDRLPSPFAFNHVIVRVRLDGQTYWLDPTLTFQFSPDPAFSQVAYGYALPIEANPQGLEKIQPVELFEPQTVMTETITLNSGSGEKPFTLDVETRYKGGDADSFRRQLADRGLADFRKSYRDYYDKLYGGVEELEKLKVDDDAANDRITVTERYAGTGGTDPEGLRKEFPLRGDTVHSVLWDADPGLKNPVRVDYPMFREHRVEIRNVPVRLTPIDRVWWSRPYLDYSLDSSFKDSRLSVIWRLRTKRDHVEPDEVKDYSKLADDIETNTEWYYDVRAPRAAAEKQKSGKK